MMNKDRFIVNRKNLNMEESGYWLQHNKPAELFKNYLENTPIANQDIHFSRKIAYIKSLSKALNIDENRRVLNFDNGGQNKGDMVLEQQWPVIPRSKPISKPQLAVLDLPRIKNDINYNVVHWGSSDYIAAALGNMIYLWHVPSSTISQTIYSNYPITALRMDRSGYFLAFSQKSQIGKIISIWDVKKFKRIHYSRLACEHECFVTCIDWHVANKYLAAGCKKGNLTIFSPTLKVISFYDKAHDDKAVFRIKFSPDGNYLASTGENTKIIIWTVPHLQIIHVQKEFFYCRGLSWHPWRSSYLCYGTFGGKIALLNTSLGKNLYETEDKNAIVYDLTFNKKTAEIVTSLTVLDLRPGGYYRYHSQVNVLARLNHVVDRFIGHSGRILYLEWSPNNETLATAGSDETIYLWKFVESNKTRLKEKNINFKSFNFI